MDYWGIRLWRKWPACAIYDAFFAAQPVGAALGRRGFVLRRVFLESISEPPDTEKTPPCPPTGVLGAPKLETPTPECLSHPTQTWSCSSAASLNPQGSSETDSCRTWETEVWPRQQTLNVWVFSETRLVFNRDELEILLKSSTFSLSFFFFFFKLYFLSL